ncbi:hypothetical protein PS1_005706 [Malus domestica]
MSMPEKPNSVRTHGDLRRGNLAFKHFTELEPMSKIVVSACSSLCSLWEEVIRKLLTLGVCISSSLDLCRNWFMCQACTHQGPSRSTRCMEKAGDDRIINVERVWKTCNMKVVNGLHAVF